GPKDRPEHAIARLREFILFANANTETVAVHTQVSCERQGFRSCPFHFFYSSSAIRFIISIGLSFFLMYGAVGISQQNSHKFFFDDFKPNNQDYPYVAAVVQPYYGTISTRRGGLVS